MIAGSYSATPLLFLHCLLTELHLRLNNIMHYFCGGRSCDCKGWSRDWSRDCGVWSCDFRVWSRDFRVWSRDCNSCYAPIRRSGNSCFALITSAATTSPLDQPHTPSTYPPSTPWSFRPRLDGLLTKKH